MSQARLRHVAQRVGQAAGLGQDDQARWAELCVRLGADTVDAVLDSRVARAPQFSAVNGTGLPVQFSAALGQDTLSARVLAEAGRPGHSMRERLMAGGQQVCAALRCLALEPLITQLDPVLAKLLPPDEAAMRDWTGALWCGATMDARGHVTLRIYLNQRWGDPAQRASRIGRSIEMVAGVTAAAHWSAAASQLDAEFKPYGVAIEADALGIRGLKAYSACRLPDWERIRAHLRLAQPEADLRPCRDVFERCGGTSAGQRPWVIAPCLVFGAHDRAPGHVRAKVDLAVCALPSSDQALDTAVHAAAAAMRLDTGHYRRLIAAAGGGDRLSPHKVERLQYISVGCVTSLPAMTVYVSPRLDPAPCMPSSACSTDAVV